MYKVIDYDKKGNLVRFYLGDIDLGYWTGDDWDDAPYEHNAGMIYEEYVRWGTGCMFSLRLGSI